jgi:putative transposase
MSSACRLMNISRQAVHQYRRRQEQEKHKVDELLQEIHPLRVLMPHVGIRKLKEHLGEKSPGRDKLFAIMREEGLLVKRRRKYAMTTNSDHDMPVYANLLSRAVVDARNQFWVADQTYIRMKTGFCYLSLVTDLYSRKIVGFKLSPTLHATGPLEALQMALRSADHWAGLIHHSDQGSQYCSFQYTELLRDHQIQISMAERRRPDQNAVAERVNGILKTEFSLDATFASFKAALRAVARAIYTYNNIRLHLNLGLMTPSMRYAA